MDLEELLAKQEIHDLLMRCMRAFDSEEWDVVRASFHPGAIHDHGSWRGPIDELIEREIVNYEKFPTNFHFTGNEYVTVDGDVAHSEMYSVCWHRYHPDGEEPVTDLVVGMRYLDRLERRDGEWRIADRVVEQDWHRADQVVDFDMTVITARHEARDPGRAE